MMKYQYDEDSVKYIMEWAESAQFPKAIRLNSVEYIFDTSLYLRASVNDIK